MGWVILGPGIVLFGIFKRKHRYCVIQEGMMTDDDDIFVFGLHGLEFRFG